MAARQGSPHEEERPQPADETADVPPPDETVEDHTSVAARLASGAIRERFARYDILDELGRGGMGIVYRARDPKLKRVVALKVLIAGEDATQEQVVRFFREAESAARLRHANIVPIHELDVHEGKHYFTMDYVEGTPLDDAIASGKLDARRAAEIIEEVARGVHYAHEQGIVHRDLKPSNIIISADARPMVMDFGLAKEVESDSKLTRSGYAMGTPAYMPPEQAEGRAGDIDARSDVYSLGAVLYEMLTRRAPFVASNLMALLRMAVEEDPVHPRVIDPRIPRDAEVIALKCLEKDPHRRYASAEELADDCRRFLAGEPILARPASLVYRARKKLARHKAVSVVTALALAVVVGLTAWYVSSLRSALQREAEQRGLADIKRREAETARDEAEAAKGKEAEQRKLAEANLERAEREDYCNKIALAQQSWDDANIGRMIDLLKSCPQRFRNWEWGRLKYLTHLELLTLKGHGQIVWSVAFSPDGKRIVSGSKDDTLKLWDAETGRELLTLEGHGGEVWSVTFSPDGKRIASGSYDKTAKIWDARTGRELHNLTGHTHFIRSVAFSPDGARLATASWDKTVRIWNPKTGRQVTELPGQDKWDTSVVFIADDRQLASGGISGNIKVWDVESGRTTMTLESGEGMVRSLAADPSGKRLASGHVSGTVKLWDLEAGRELMSLEAHGNQVWSVVFSPDGKRLASGGWDNKVKVWDVETGDELMALSGHAAAVNSVAFSPDGKRLASGSVDKSVRLWDAESRPDIVVLKGHKGGVWSLAFSPDGGQLASGAMDGTVRLWDVEAGQERTVLRGHAGYVPSVVFCRDGKSLASASWDKTVKLWDAKSGAELATLKGHDNGILALAVSSDGSRLASGAGTVKIWELNGRRELMNLSGDSAGTFAVAFNPDGRWLAWGGYRGIFGLYDLGTGLELLRLETGSTIRSVAFSPDGKRMALGGGDCTVKILEAPGGQELVTLKGHTGIVNSVTFAPDGSRLVSGSSDRTLRIWDGETGRELLVLKGHSEAVQEVAFSPNGTQIASASDDGTILIWPADPWWEPGNPPKRPKPVSVAPAGKPKAGEEF